MYIRNNTGNFTFNINAIDNLRFGFWNVYINGELVELETELGKCKTYDIGVYFFEFFQKDELKETQEFLNKR